MDEKEFKILIMKALGWYMHTHKDIRQCEIAKKMNITAAVISKSVITPKNEGYNENDILRNKRLIDISRAIEICTYMGTTLANVLYYYQFKNFLEDSTKIDELEKLTNKLTNLSKGQELQVGELEQTIKSIQSETNELKSSLGNASNLITNVENKNFKPWFGKYFCYFSSTSSDEAGKKRIKHFNRTTDDIELKELFDCVSNDYIFCGIMNIYEKLKFNDSLCHVDFKFLADPDKRVIKKYSGTITLSATTKAGFCELNSDEQGEKTYLIVERQDLGRVQPNIRCCIAMVLTFSSKVHRRRPCCERMIISSDKINEGTEEYETLKAYLRMNDSTIRITQWGYNELINHIKQSNDPELLEIAQMFPNLHSLKGNNVPIDECAFIPESMVETLHTLNESQKRKFEILLRIHSIAPWYCKTKATKADIIFNIVNNSKKE